MQAGERRVQWIQSKSLRLCGAVFSAYANMPTLRKLLLDIQQTQKKLSTYSNEVKRRYEYTDTRTDTHNTYLCLKIRKYMANK